MLNQPYSQNLWPNNSIFSHRPTHTTIEIIWIEIVLMVFKSSKLELNPKTKITWTWDLSCEHLTLDTCIYLQCITLHYRTKKALINMLETIPTHNLSNFYPTLRNYKIHILWNIWRPMDMQVINSVGLTCKNGQTRGRKKLTQLGLWDLSSPPRKQSTLHQEDQTPPHPPNEKYAS